MIKNALNFKSRGTKKSNFPPRGPTMFKFWEMIFLLFLITNMQECYVGYTVIAER